MEQEVAAGDRRQRFASGRRVALHVGPDCGVGPPILVRRSPPTQRALARFPESPFRARRRGADAQSIATGADFQPAFLLFGWGRWGGPENRLWAWRPVRQWRDLPRSVAGKLLREAADRATELGFPWEREPLVLRPSGKLAGLIRRSRALSTEGDSEAEGAE